MYHREEETGRSSTVQPVSTDQGRMPNVRLVNTPDGGIAKSTDWDGAGSVEAELDAGGSLQDGLSGQMPFRRTMAEATTAGCNGVFEETVE